MQKIVFILSIIFHIFNYIYNNTEIVSLLAIIVDISAII